MNRLVTTFFVMASFVVLYPASLGWSAGPEELAGHRTDGIWKSATPRHAMTGEFDNSDPIGLAAGAIIRTDCSLNWIDPDDHKVYCFNSATSVEYFRQWPQHNLRRQDPIGTR